MSYSIRPCRAHDELAACVTVQKRVWGYSDRELYPLRLLVNLTRIGGQVLGAFTPHPQLVGFVAAMPAWREGRRYYHSLSLGVLPGHQSRGLGTALKLKQRESAVEGGIDLIEWTFDPLRAKNAFFNIVRLGVIVRRYLPDYYGTVDSRLQGGLPSDRLIAEWWLSSPRVSRVVRGENALLNGRKPEAEIAIPSNFESLLRWGLRRARAEQARVREQLQEGFARGLAITGFARDRSGTRYLLGRFERA